jgi:hypothetical protein
MGVHDCNPSYMRGEGRKIIVQIQVKKSKAPSAKAKGAGEWAKWQSTCIARRP